MGTGLTGVGIETNERLGGLAPGSSSEDEAMLSLSKDRSLLLGLSELDDSSLLSLRRLVGASSQSRVAASEGLFFAP